MELKISNWLKNKRILILYGTYDQTDYLLKNIKNFNKLNINGFIPYKNYNDNYLNKKRKNFSFPIIKKNSKILKSINYDILISSYEYSFDIERDILRNFKNKNYFKIYNGYSRDLRFYKKIKEILD